MRTLKIVVKAREGSKCSVAAFEEDGGKATKREDRVFAAVIQAVRVAITEMAKIESTSFNTALFENPSKELAQRIRDYYAKEEN